MSIHRTKTNKYEVRWRSEQKNHSRTFDSEHEAQTFEDDQAKDTWNKKVSDTRERIAETRVEGGNVVATETAHLIAEAQKQRKVQKAPAPNLNPLEGVWTPGTRPTDAQRKMARLLVKDGQVEVPREGFDDGTPWKWFPGGGADRTLTKEQIERQRALVKVRQKAAAEHGVAIGWINHEGKLLDNAKRMDGSQPL